MKLNKQIILQLIKEEIEKNILQELRSEETDAVAQIVAILTRLDAEKMNTDSVMDEAEKQFQAAQQAANADTTPANRDGFMGEDLTKKQIKGRDDDAKSIMKSTKKQYGKEEGESAAYAIATNIQKEKAKKK